MGIWRAKYEDRQWCAYIFDSDKANIIAPTLPLLMGTIGIFHSAMYRNNIIPKSFTPTNPGGYHVSQTNN